MQTGLVLRPEVGYTVEPPADLTRSMQGEIADRSLTPHHLQLQDCSGLLLVQALVTHVQIQNIGSSAVDVDRVVRLVNQTHHGAAVNVTKLQSCIACDAWCVRKGEDGEEKKG